jgi:hypothetical protein
MSNRDGYTSRDGQRACLGYRAAMRTWRSGHSPSRHRRVLRRPPGRRRAVGAHALPHRSCSVDGGRRRMVRAADYHRSHVHAGSRPVSLVARRMPREDADRVLYLVDPICELAVPPSTVDPSSDATALHAHSKSRTDGFSPDLSHRHSRSGQPTKSSNSPSFAPARKAAISAGV